MICLLFSDSIPGVGGGSKDDDEMSKEEQAEQEKMRLDAIKQAEKERRDKYKKQEDERENLRQGIRDKVTAMIDWLKKILKKLSRIKMDAIKKWM